MYAFGRGASGRQISGGKQSSGASDCARTPGENLSFTKVCYGTSGPAVVAALARMIPCYDPAASMPTGRDPSAGEHSSLGGESMNSTPLRRALSAVVAALALSLYLAPAAQAQPELPPRARLRDGDILWVERWFHSVQSQYESGRISDVELRDAYRRLYDLDDPLVEQLKSWVEKRPDSYAAHLLLGVHYKHLGDDSRGGDFIQNTSRPAIFGMEHFHQLAMRELERSTHLTAKPYLSWFLMLGIAQDEGRPAEKLAILEQAVRLDPVAELVRVRYMTTLTPRWGGSLPQMEAFVERSRRENVPERVIHELQAIAEDDLGHDREDKGDGRGARQHYEKALALAQDSAPFFLGDALSSTQRVLCGDASTPSPNCPR
jgi:tetratricopeptide (TPR) repeat protein